MFKKFCTTGPCDASIHYMVNIDDKLVQIKKMIDQGDYFVINRSRQYGKTTTLLNLVDFISSEYEVIFIDFQGFAKGDFSSTKKFSQAFLKRLTIYNFKDQLVKKCFQDQFLSGLNKLTIEISDLFIKLSEFCAHSPKPIVLLIDEVDQASNYDVFVDFLSQIRSSYIQRIKTPTFKSVILAGVQDLQTLKRRMRSDQESIGNSPWNIATDFDIDLSLQPLGIANMLEEYKNDYSLTFDQKYFANQIYAYTSGYPYLVSKICEIIDLKISNDANFNSKEKAWTEEGFLKAINILLISKNTLFGSLDDKLDSYPQLQSNINSILLTGNEVGYNPRITWQNEALMYGFLKIENNKLVVANRIFETYLYNNLLTSDEAANTEEYKLAIRNKPKFVTNGYLDMELILQKFVEVFHDLYGEQLKDLSSDDPKNYAFIEEEGRRRFLLFLRPIINGAGNYYIEAQTRDQKRTDLIVDYLGKRYIVELKIWHGNSYNERGEEQLTGYLEYFHQTEGYMLSFNFNKNKQIGIKHNVIGKYKIIEAVV